MRRASVAAAYATHRLLDEALGRSLAAQVVSVGAGLLAGAAVYIGIVLLAKVPEAASLARMVRRRLA